MEKTLDLFSRIYQPVQTRLEEFTNSVADPVMYFNELERTVRNYEALRSDSRTRLGMRIPFLVAREIAREGDTGDDGLFHIVLFLVGDQRARVSRIVRGE